MHDLVIYIIAGPKPLRNRVFVIVGNLLPEERAELCDTIKALGG